MSTERQQTVNRASTELQQSFNRASTEHQQSVNDSWCWILYNARAVLQLLPIIEALAIFIGNTDNFDVASPNHECQKSVNYFRGCILYNPRAMQQLLSIIEVVVALLGNMVSVDVTTPNNEPQQSVNRVSTERVQSISRASTEDQQSVNRASTERNRASMICIIAHFIIWRLCDRIGLKLKNCRRLWAMQVELVLLHLESPSMEHQQFWKLPHV